MAGFMYPRKLGAKLAVLIGCRVELLVQLRIFGTQPVGDLIK
jgi:hypothetical protein